MEALTYLGGQPSGKRTGAREIAAATRIPMPFLWKILRQLSQEKLVQSFRGVRGGYELARPAGRIVVSEILRASPDTDLANSCMLGRAQCNDVTPCPLHSYWKGIRQEIRDVLERTTLADLARKARKSSGKRSRASP